MPPMPALPSFLSSSLGAAVESVGNLFSSTTPPDANKAQKASTETNDATHATLASGSTRAATAERDLHNRPPETNIRERRRDYRGPDERRLTGDYGTPADAVIIKPPTARAPMARSKPFSGICKPLNTLGHAGPFGGRPRGRPETYSTKHRLVPRLDSLKLQESRGDNVIRQGRIYARPEGELSPYKRRKTQTTMSPPNVIDLEQDDPTPSDTHRRERIAERDLSFVQSSFSSHSQNSFDSGRRTTYGSFTPNEFRTVNETVDPRRRKQKHLQSQPGNRKSTTPTRAPPNTFSISQGRNRTGNAGLAIEVSDDDSIPQHAEIKRSSNLMEPLQRLLESTSPSPPRPALQDHESNLKSKYFHNRSGGVSGEEDSIVEIRDSYSSSEIYRGLKRSFQSERSRSPPLRTKFKRIDDLDSSIDELQRPESVPEQRSTRMDKPSNTTHPANSAARRKPGKGRNSGWPMKLVRTHGKTFVGPTLNLKHDDETKSFYVRIYNADSSSHILQDRIELRKINRALKEDEKCRIRVIGSRVNTQTWTYDLEFSDRKSYNAFLLYVTTPDIKVYSKSSGEMDTLFGQKLEAGPSCNTLGPSDVYDDGVDELALLQARTQRDTNHAQSLQATVEPSVQHRRQNNLKSKLRASLPDDVTEKRLQNLKDNVCLDATSVEQKPSPGRLRSTRLSNLMDKSRTISNQRPSPPPPESIPYSIDPGLGPKWDQPVIYPPTGRRRAHVDFDDLLRLDDGEFLNDNLIDFYMNWAYNNANLPPNKVYFFNTYFYSSLSKPQKGQRGINYNSVQRWTAKEDIFNYDYVVVPINEDAHWYVAIICNLTKIDRILHKEPSSEAATRSSPNQLEESDKIQDAINNSSDETERKRKENSIHESNDPDVIDDPLDRDESEDLSLIQHDMNLVKRGIPQAQDEQQIKYDDEEWPDPQENRRSYATSPFQETLAMRNLSIQEESAGGLLASPTPKSDIGGKKKSRRKSAPGLKKYDPDEPIIIVLDSLGATHPRTVRHLKDYVLEEGKAKRNIDAIIDKSMNPKEIPLQNNFCDCGLFLLGYLDKFFVNPKEFVTKILTREMSVEIDWPDLDPKQMRNCIRNLLFKLAKGQQAERRKLELEKREKRKKKMSPSKRQASEASLERTTPALLKQQSPPRPPNSPQVVIQRRQPKPEPTEPKVAVSVESGVNARSRQKSSRDPNDLRQERHIGNSEELVEIENSQSQARTVGLNSLPLAARVGSSEELIEIADSQPSPTPATSRSNDVHLLKNTNESQEFADVGFLKDTLRDQLERSAGYSAEAQNRRRERRMIEVDTNVDYAENDHLIQPLSLTNPSPSSRRQPAEDIQRPPTRGKTY